MALEEINNGGFIGDDSAESVYESFNKVKRNFESIDQSLIENTNVQPDLNQTDDTQPDYIKGQDKFVPKSGGDFNGDVSVSQNDGVASSENSGVNIGKDGSLSIWGKNNKKKPLLEAYQFLNEQRSRFFLRFFPTDDTVDYSVFGGYNPDDTLFDLPPSTLNPQHSGYSFWWLRQLRSLLIVGKETSEYNGKEVNDNLTAQKGYINDFRANRLRNLTTQQEQRFGDGELISQLKDGTLVQSKFFEFSGNLFRKETRDNTSGFLPADGVIRPSGGWNISDFISVNQSTQYIASGDIRFVTAFDENFNVIQSEGINDNTPSATPFLTGSNTYYIKITINDANLPLFQLQAGGVLDTYRRNYYRINPKALDFHASDFEGFSVSQIGDSLTAQNEIFSYVQNALNFTYNNLGVGGTKISGSESNSINNDSRINAIPITSDVVVISGSTNDWAQNVPLGVSASTDILDFSGGLNTTIVKCINRFPDRLIVLITPPYSELQGRVAANIWSNAYTNTEGLTINDYADRMKEIAKSYAIPVIDVNTKCGINALNINNYMKDDGGRLHPNSELGGKRIASVVVSGLKQLATNMFNNL